MASFKIKERIVQADIFLLLEVDSECCPWNRSHSSSVLVLLIAETIGECSNGPKRQIAIVTNKRLERARVKKLSRDRNMLGPLESLSTVVVIGVVSPPLSPSSLTPREQSFLQLRRRDHTHSIMRYKDERDDCFRVDSMIVRMRMTAMAMPMVAAV